MGIALDIRVLVADDHPLMRDGVRRLLDATPGMQVVGEAGNGHEVIELLRHREADVALLDLSMPGMPGIDLIRRVKSEFPRVAVLVLTMHAEDEYAVRALRSGASGYLLKDSGGEELLRAVRKVAAGGGYVAPALAERLVILLSTLGPAMAHAGLSDRELEVLRRIVAGERITTIADGLHLSVKTVSTHKARILEKLGLDSSAALVRYALEHRLFDDDAAADFPVVGPRA